MLDTSVSFSYTDILKILEMILLFVYGKKYFVEKQKEQEEKRYKLYFVYSSKTGRVYVLKFTDKIRIITIYPIGKQALKNYKRKFKKIKALG